MCALIIKKKHIGAVAVDESLLKVWQTVLNSAKQY
jgi:hypothetical protein